MASGVAAAVALVLRGGHHILPPPPPLLHLHLLEGGEGNAVVEDPDPTQRKIPSLEPKDNTVLLYYLCLNRIQ